MKHLRSGAAILLTLVMTFFMCPTVAAAEPVGSITISGVTVGKTYQIFKILDLTMSGEISYTIDSDWADFFAGTGSEYITDEPAAGGDLISMEDKTGYIHITEDNVAEFSQAALAYAAGKIPDASRTASGSAVAFTDLDLGYYLVYPQGASEIRERQSCICSLTAASPSAGVTVKAEYPAIQQTGDVISADLGQAVTYTIIGKVPDTTGFTTYEYTIRNVMTDGLTFCQDVRIHIGEQLVSVALDYETIANGFIVTFDMSKWQDYVGQPILVTYTATVNRKALREGEAEKSSATLTYSYDPGDNTEKTTTSPVVAMVCSSQIVIDKVDGDHASRKLEGARFVLMNDKGAYYKLQKERVVWVEAEDEALIVTTDQNGAASFAGLKYGTYSLKEVQAPDGYDLLPSPMEVSVYSSNKEPAGVRAVAAVENNSGAMLPATGGAGTTAIYVIGGGLALGSVITLVLRKRMRF